jgi:hypothetical protein
MNWIKVTDAKPEPLQRVILWVDGIGGGYAAIGHRKHDNLYYKDKGTLSKPMEFISHWMPTPEKPLV